MRNAFADSLHVCATVGVSGRSFWQTGLIVPKLVPDMRVRYQHKMQMHVNAPDAGAAWIPSPASPSEHKETPAISRFAAFQPISRRP